MFLHANCTVSVLTRVPFRAERASNTVSGSDHPEGLCCVLADAVPKEHKKPPSDLRSVAETNPRAERAQRGADADTIATAHLHYHGNGVWSSNAWHPDSARL